MRITMCLCVSAAMMAGSALAEPVDENGGMNPTVEEIRSGMIIDDGLDIPSIRPGTQYFEIHGSTRIARALGEDRLPTDDAGLQPDPLQSDEFPRTAQNTAAW